MLAKLTYGSALAVGQNWHETEVHPAKRAAQEAVLLSAILFTKELPEHDFMVGKRCQWLRVRSGCYFIEVELVELEAAL
jgi:hypothetical protein